MVRKKSRINKWQSPVPPLDIDLGSINSGHARTEFGADGEWMVRDVNASRALKTYTCPGCHLIIPAGVAHLVAWRLDGPQSDEHALAERRHWHVQCWRQRVRR